MVTKFVCGSASTASGQFIRQVLSANQTRDALTQSGGSNVAVSFAGASAGSADISGSGSFSGVKVAGGALLYAAGGGNLGVTVTTAQVNGIDVKQQVTDAIARATGRDLSSLSIGFAVDRVYSCAAGKDSFLVLEGHA
jgi:hypothetical protein